mgnify:CR=1 FL=1
MHKGHTSFHERHMVSHYWHKAAFVGVWSRRRAHTATSSQRRSGPTEPLNSFSIFSGSEGNRDVGTATTCGASPPPPYGMRITWSEAIVDPAGCTPLRVTNKQPSSSDRP